MKSDRQKLRMLRHAVEQAHAKILQARRYVRREDMTEAITDAADTLFHALSSTEPSKAGKPCA